MTIGYSVIESAGSIDERVFADFRNLEEAQGWMRDAYEPDEIESLNVRIAKDVDGERIYEPQRIRTAARAGGCWRGDVGRANRPGWERTKPRGVSLNPMLTLPAICATACTGHHLNSEME